MNQHSELTDRVERLQYICISHATGGPEHSSEYQLLRTQFLQNHLLKDLVPGFVRRNRDLDQFWHFIKAKFSTYQERREYIWQEFRPLLDHLESGQATPVEQSVDSALVALNSDTVREAWRRMLERRSEDAEGTLTAARALVESVCKHILDEQGIEYKDDAELPKLYKATAESLNIAPSQHTEKVFKQILGGCTAVVEGLGAVRNKLGDAHGKGRKPVKPAPRHAELAANLAGSMATFLVATWEARG